MMQNQRLTDGQMRLDVAAISEMGPELALCASILRMAFRDLRHSSERIRSEAIAFWRGHRGSLTAWCELLGIDPSRIRAYAEEQASQPVRKSGS